jgi:hypothetical protein
MTAGSGLVAADFRALALRGAGDRLNAYAHSAAWFRHALYLGATRANLSLIKQRAPGSLDPWPTRVPADIYDDDLRAQVLAYEPEAQTWRCAYRSPLVEGHGGEVPRELGYRGMALFRAPDDSAAALYVAGWASARSGRPPTLLRSRNGIDFDAIGTLGRDPTITSYRTLLASGGRLYAAPTGRLGGAANTAGAAVLQTTRSPMAGWRTAFAGAEESDLGIVEAVPFGRALYASTINNRGFSLWRCLPKGPPPYTWTRILAQGAGRGPLNQAGLSLCVFNDALYIGTAIQNGGYDRAAKIGPAAAELLRVHPDGSWDLIVGDQRGTADGKKQPLSGLGSGFDNPFNAYIWRMVVHEGWLYASTYNWAVFLPYLSLREFPGLRSRIDDTHRARLTEEWGGFELWRSNDGIRWSPVIQDGFGTPYNYGGRALVSTPHGLMVGTANPFGPEIAVRTGGRWCYAPNPRGGLEVWLGAP